MLDTQTMKKAMRITIKKVQTIFVRRKPKDSIPCSSEDGSCKSTQIEDGLEVNENQPAFSPGNSTESSPEPLEVFQLSEDENCDYFVHHRETNRHKAREMKLNKSSDTVIVKYNGDQEGACGPLVTDYKNCDQQVVPYSGVTENSCRSAVLTSCGDLEKTCSNFPLELQAKISVIKENLLRQYPPFYDFCIIASDKDYDDVVRFKKYVSSSFGLAGCTLDDGFVSLGADLFDCYKMMMDQSTKVFFFVTENFTSSAFCKRLQSGAVFSSLMSKAQKDREKCVPVFPNGFCMAPLALSGIAGLNPTQRDVTRRSLDNTYSPLLRQRRLVWDQENFKKRCVEFQKEVTKCIEEAKSEINKAESLQNELSVMNVTTNDNANREEESVPAIEVSPPSPVIQMSENENLDRCHSTESHREIKSVEKKKCRESESDRQEHMFPQRKCSVQNKENSKVTNEKHVNVKGYDNDDGNDDDGNDDDGNNDDGNDDGNNDDNGNDDCDDNSADKDEFLKNLPIPDEYRDAMNNSVSTVSINDCGTVQVGHVFHIIINQTPSTDISHLEQHINSKTEAFGEKKTFKRDSESSS